jgi:magnesium-transporting ATPase (P-type)
MTPIQKVVD